ncbi:unnamed protein product [Eruca vesicaria subsp. sativa]|uniref:Uncharacterized protein n=1 Tax=Eruca vesicaria subsp. sativa TaxID=29727 RepID=A0ABC8IUW9_ERUVS|nr:unnamed protein product [Eruca vesicaria subsp. sativa]
MPLRSSLPLTSVSLYASSPWLHAKPFPSHSLRSVRASVAAATTRAITTANWITGTVFRSSREEIERTKRRRREIVEESGDEDGWHGKNERLRERVDGDGVVVVKKRRAIAPSLRLRILSYGG